MLTLHLLRHAKSSWDIPELPDRERPLNQRGIRAAQALAAHLRPAGIAPGLVLCSPALRARQTLDLIATGLSVGVPVEVDESLYGATAQGLWRRIRQLPDELVSVLLVGHNPGMHEFASSLVGERAGDRVGEADEPAQVAVRHKLPTCSLVTVTWTAGSWSSLRRTDAVLEAFVRPRDLG